MEVEMKLKWMERENTNDIDPTVENASAYHVAVMQSSITCPFGSN